MKARSGTFALKLIVLAAVAIIAVLTFRAFAQATPTPPPPGPFKFTLKIGKSQTEYVNVKSKKEFDDALCTMEKNGGDIHEVGYKEDANASPTPIGEYKPKCRTVSINTDKVTESELAKNAPAGESAANDPNAVHRVQSNSAKDMQDLLGTFQE